MTFQQRGVTAMRADAEETADQGRSQHVAMEDAGERGEERRRLGVGCHRTRRLLQAAADVDDEKRRQQPDRKQDAPGDIRRRIGKDKRG